MGLLGVTGTCSSESFETKKEMFIATTTKKAATVTWYIINTIVLVFRSGRKQCNEDKHAIYAFFCSVITYINKITTINLYVAKLSVL